MLPIVFLLLIVGYKTFTISFTKIMLVVFNQASATLMIADIMPATINPLSPIGDNCQYKIRTLLLQVSLEHALLLYTQLNTLIK